MDTTIKPLSINDPPGLRLALRGALAPELFEAQPWRGFLGYGELALMVLLVWALHSLSLPWYWKLATALLLGQLIVSVALVLGHENAHGAIFRSGPWRTLSSALGVSFFLLTPATRQAWHVLAHHAQTNNLVGDPECLFTLEAFHSKRIARLIHTTVPGSRHALSFVSFFFLFTLQGQLFLWHYLDEPGYLHLPFNRARERVKTVALVLAWVALGVVLGPSTSLYALVIPMLTANFTLLCYIATQHWLSPATPEVNNPFLNTISQTVHPLFDLLHWNFSYHQEHHIFPSMSHGFLPRVRGALLRLHPEASVVYPLWRAVLALYRKPALYRDPQTLVRPDDSHPFALSAVPSLVEPAALRER